MENLISKFKPAGKMVGIFLGALLLWAVFSTMTGGQSGVLKDQKSFGQNMPMSGIGEMSLSKEVSDVDMTESEMTVFDGEGVSERAVAQSAIVSSEPVLIEKKVIKNGNLILKVESTEQSAQKISEFVKSFGGEVFSTNFYEKTKGQKSGSITVKVPVEKFNEALSQIKTVATQVFSESTTGRDVTEQYSDLQAQLKNKRAEEESFVKILDRAGEIEDVLAVIKQISRVRGEIERLEGRIRFMDSQTDMSTITISLSEDVEIAPVQNDWRPWQVIKKAFNDLIINIQDFVDGIIRFIIIGIPSLIPFLVFLGIVYWAGKKIWAKMRN
ncbi:MAG: DUF4349 domain-containing protein [Patescibacteria group bacterium]|nr:DUF4349 domain-containing protein [Patescibacteria group bacterium]